MERFSYLLTYGSQTWPYILFLLVYCTVFLVPRSFRRYALYVAIGWVIFFGGFKDIMSPDFANYKAMYENYDRLNLSNIEPFYIFLSWVLNQLKASFYTLSFVYFFFTVTFVIIALDNLANDLEYAFFIWLTIPGFFLNTFVEMRQMLAVALFFLAITLWLKKSRKSLLYSVVSFALAALNHYSSIPAIIVFFALYKFVNRRYSFMSHSFILIIGFIAGMSNIVAQLMKMTKFVIPEKYLYYLSYGDKTDPLKLGIYLLYALIILILYHANRSNHTNSVMLNLFILGVFILLISPSNHISREAYYFLILQTALIPNMLRSVSTRHPEEKVLLTYTFTMFFIAQYVYGLFFTVPGETEHFVFLPYKNIFVGILE